MIKELDIKTRITLHAAGNTDRHGFGKGIEMLLSGVARLGSLNKAAKELGMAYSKAWNIVRRVEDQLQVELIDRHGPHGSDLTEEGRLLLEHYREMTAAAEAAAKKVYDKYF